MRKKFKIKGIRNTILCGIEFFKQNFNIFLIQRT
jgi:hypothetical protein